MKANENAQFEVTQNDSVDSIDDAWDLDEFESKFQNKLDSQLADLEFLEEDRAKIGNPDALGKTVLDEVWKQFGKQLGLDITNETLIQQYDMEHPETYGEIKDDIMKDQRYKDANKEMKQQQKSGDLKDEYTGKTIGQNDNANLDHVVSRKELFENQRRKQANIDTKDLANKDENLKPTNENLNKSKNAKSVDEYIENRETREAELIKQNERANKKVDDSNMSDVEKRLQKEKLDNAMQNKLDADDGLMKEADNEARKAINKDIRTGAVKEVGKKAGEDALKTAAISALFSLLKEIMNGFVRFLKSKSKTFNNFLLEMKEAIHSFFSKIMSVLQTGVSALVGTIVSEIFGPIVSIFKKLASFIKQGVSSFIEAINYLKDKNNKSKPFSVKVAQVGKIITDGMMVGNAIILGEVFEKLLLTLPGMQITFPLIGTLANVIGLFLASLISGLIGAIIMNLLDKFIAKRLASAIIQEEIAKGNEILNTQVKIIDINETKLCNTKNIVANSVMNRHEAAANVMRDSLTNILADSHNDDIVVSENNDEFEDMLNNLSNL